MSDGQNIKFLDEIAAEIRAGLALSRAKLAEVEPPAGSPIDLKLTGAIELVRELDSGRALAGSPPPVPPTLRGRLGNTLVTLVRRALFWYTPPLQAFQRLVATALSEHAGALADVARNQRAIFDEQRRAFHEQQIETLRLTQELVTRLSNLERETQTIRNQTAVAMEASVRSRELFDRVAAIEDGMQLRESEHSKRQAELGAIRSEIESVRALFEPRSVAAESSLQHMSTRLAAVEAGQASSLQAIDGAMAQRLAAELEPVQTAHKLTADHARSLDRFTHSTRAQLVLLERRVSILLEEARRSGTLQSPNGAGQASVDLPVPDPVYLDFEDIFRGDRADIKSRHEVYLPYLRDASTELQDLRILDIGCGRGEWLELLRENGFSATGVDGNSSMVAACRERGLDVQHGEAIHHLRTLPSGSLGGVTGLHIIEHLPIASLVALVDEVLRVLKPGGLVIFETPNPDNMLVSSNTFYLDPTHQKPLPSLLTRFILESRGFCRIEALPLHPFPPSFRLPEDSEAAKLLNERFFGAQDYAVIGRKV